MRNKKPRETKGTQICTVEQNFSIVEQIASTERTKTLEWVKLVLIDEEQKLSIMEGIQFCTLEILVMLKQITSTKKNKKIRHISIKIGAKHNFSLSEIKNCTAHRMNHNGKILPLVNHFPYYNETTILD